MPPNGSEDKSFEHELSKLKQTKVHHQQKAADAAAAAPLQISDFMNRPFSICCLLMAAHEVNGVFTMVSYTNLIFTKSGSALSPGVSSIIVGAIQLVGAYISTLLVDRLGRKVIIIIIIIIASKFQRKIISNRLHHLAQLNRKFIYIFCSVCVCARSILQLLMVFSFAGCAVCQIILATYIFLATATDVDVSAFKTIPVVSFSAMIFIAASGALPVPFVIIAEILPDKVSPVVFFVYCTQIKMNGKQCLIINQSLALPLKLRLISKFCKLKQI